MTRRRKIRPKNTKERGPDGAGRSESRPIRSEEIVRQNRRRIEVARQLLSDSDRLLREESPADN